MREHRRMGWGNMEKCVEQAMFISRWTNIFLRERQKIPMKLRTSHVHFNPYEDYRDTAHSHAQDNISLKWIAGRFSTLTGEIFSVPGCCEKCQREGLGFRFVVRESFFPLVEISNCTSACCSVWFSLNGSHICDTPPFFFSHALHLSQITIWKRTKKVWRESKHNWTDLRYIHHCKETQEFSHHNANAEAKKPNSL